MGTHLERIMGGKLYGNETMVSGLVGCLDG